MFPSLAVALLLAEANPSALELPPLQLHGFVDVFYGLNTNQPADRTSFLPGTGTTARRANELNLNAAAVDLSVEPKPVGMHLTLAFGSGPDVVHSAAPASGATGTDIWRFVYQASVSATIPIGSGRLVAAGIYPAPTRVESLLSKDNRTDTPGRMGEF